MARKPTLSTPTADRLREVVNYDPETGIFTRRLQGRGTRVGRALGTPHGDGYLTICIDGRNRYAHRMAWLYMTGDHPSAEVDHENNAHADNRWSNLRLATTSENIQNQVRAHRDSLTGILGVTFDKQRGLYASSIIIDRRKLHLGRFATAEDARSAYIAAKRELHPFGRL
jgi:hypothetical protein